MQRLLIQTGGELLMRWFTSVLRTPAPPPPAGAEPARLPPPQTGEVLAAEPGCPVCRLHRETAEAKGLLEGLVAKTEERGAIPVGLGGTIPLVRQNYAACEHLLQSIAIMAPELRRQCVELSRAVSAIEQRLSGTVAPAQVPALAQESILVWRQSYELAASFFARRPSTEFEHWIDWVKAERPSNAEAEQRLRGVLNGPG